MWLGQSRGIRVIYVFHLCYRNDYFKMNDHDLFLWSFKCNKLFATWPITDTYMYVWYKKKRNPENYFLIVFFSFPGRRGIRKNLKIQKESYRTSRTNAKSNWRRQVVKLKAFLSQRFSIAEQEVTGKVPQQISWCIKIKKFARMLASLQYCDNKFLSV